jgi:hypothetical protein
MNFPVNSNILLGYARLMGEDQFEISSASDFAAFVIQAKSRINTVSQQLLYSRNFDVSAFDYIKSELKHDLSKFSIVHINLDENTVELPGARVGAALSLIFKGVLARKIEQVSGKATGASDGNAKKTLVRQFTAQAVNQEVAAQRQQYIAQAEHEVDLAIEEAKAFVLSQQENKPEVEKPVEGDRKPQRPTKLPGDAKAEETTDRRVVLLLSDKGRKGRDVREEQRASAEFAAKERKLFQEHTEALDEKDQRIKKDLHKRDRIKGR